MRLASTPPLAVVAVPTDTLLRFHPPEEGLAFCIYTQRVWVIPTPYLQGTCSSPSSTVFSLQATAGDHEEDYAQALELCIYTLRT